MDPTLDALFASSVRSARNLGRGGDGSAVGTDTEPQVGPAEKRAKPKYEPLVAAKQRAAPAPAPVKPLSKDEEEAAAEDSDEDEDVDEEDDDDEDDEESDDDNEESEPSAATAPADLKNGAGKRKRKNRDEDDDLESRYFEKLALETDAPAEKRAKRGDAADADADEEMAEDKADGEDSEDADETIVHESLAQNGGGQDGSSDAADGQIDEQDKEKAARTVFLSNVSISAITGKAAKKMLMAHLGSIFDDEPTKDDKDDKEKSALENLRFRSVPFASAALPKRASYITKAVMSATAQSTNAYAVYSTVAAARIAVRKLNGTVVLDRHLRADSVAHPSPVDHRRCVFVGNLGFVDDETVLSANPEADGEGGEMSRKKRNKTPMDVEEGLWRTFGKHAGKVESVRVIRDQITRVGKGIAYVQFYVRFFPLVLLSFTVGSAFFSPELLLTGL